MNVINKLKIANNVIVIYLYCYYSYTHFAFQHYFAYPHNATPHFAPTPRASSIHCARTLHPTLRTKTNAYCNKSNNITAIFLYCYNSYTHIAYRHYFVYPHYVTPHFAPTPRMRSIHCVHTLHPTLRTQINAYCPRNMHL